jgi:nondiscriminating glutamyl-tRNA synthetase
MKANGYPTYHFANVIDDWKMEISHVMRGVEWLTNTSKHLYLYNILEKKPPIFIHLPLVFTTDGKKLSKRDPTAPINNMKLKGYLP